MNKGRPSICDKIRAIPRICFTVPPEVTIRNTKSTSAPVIPRAITASNDGRSSGWTTSRIICTLTLAAGVTSFSASHQYLDDNPSGTASDNYPISVTVTDNHGASGTAGTGVTVNNVAPVVAPITGPSPSPGVRGQALTLTALRLLEPGAGEGLRAIEVRQPGLVVLDLLLEVRGLEGRMPDASHFDHAL